MKSLKLLFGAGSFVVALMIGAHSAWSQVGEVSESIYSENQENIVYDVYLSDEGVVPMSVGLRLRIEEVDVADYAIAGIATQQPDGTWDTRLVAYHDNWFSGREPDGSAQSSLAKWVLAIDLVDEYEAIEASFRAGLAVQGLTECDLSRTVSTVYNLPLSQCTGVCPSIEQQMEALENGIDLLAQGFTMQATESLGLYSSTQTQGLSLGKVSRRTRSLIAGAQNKLRTQAMQRWNLKKQVQRVEKAKEALGKLWNKFTRRSPRRPTGVGRAATARRVLSSASRNKLQAGTAALRQFYRQTADRIKDDILESRCIKLIPIPHVNPARPDCWQMFSEWKTMMKLAKGL